MKNLLKNNGLRVSWLIMLVLAQTYVFAQNRETVDKTVAVVRNAGNYELITYSDLMWQLALQPGAQLSPPRSEDLNRVLQTLIDQRLFSLESKRLPRSAPSKAEIDAEIKRILRYFPSTAVFESRLRQVGFDSIKDEAFENLIASRLSTEKYLDFRFRSFVVVSADEEARYYRDVFVPDFRRRYPGLLVPTLDDRRDEIHSILIENKVAERIESFLDDAKARVEIEVLIEV